MVAIATALQKAVEEADRAGYARGVVEGEQAAREELAAIKKKLAAIVGETADIKSPQQAMVSSMKVQDTVEVTLIRVPRGSVAPAVLDALRTSQRGMSPREVANVADIPENSARGSLNKLRHDGAVKKTGQLWFLAKDEGSNAGAPEPSH